MDQTLAVVSYEYYAQHGCGCDAPAQIANSPWSAVSILFVGILAWETFRFLTARALCNYFFGRHPVVQGVKRQDSPPEPVDVIWTTPFGCRAHTTKMCKSLTQSDVQKLKEWPICTKCK